MGMSTYVEALGQPDERWWQMKEVWEACTTADIEIPREVNEFFDWAEPKIEDGRTEIELPQKCMKKYTDDSREGIEINLEELPEGVEILRFINSW